MAASGKPTPPETGRVPRFKDPMQPRVGDDVNPYFLGHRTYGPTLLPASEAWPWKGNWDKLFGRSAPLHLEIGCGNGFFLAGMAAVHPEVNFVGIEIRYKRVVLTARKIDKAGLPNARIVRYHAAYLDDLFEDNSLDCIYVNHPDPWPKERHEKNRLISSWFMSDVARLLKVGGEFRLKSDFKPNVDRVVPSIEGLPLMVADRSDDLRTHVPWPMDVQTNYQRKFDVRDEPVYAIRVTRTEGTAPALDLTQARWNGQRAPKSPGVTADE